MDKEIPWELDAQQRSSSRGLVVGVRESETGGGKGEGPVAELGDGEGPAAELGGGDKRAETGLARAGAEVPVVPVGDRGDVAVPREGEWF